jgi:hypothetical protein
VVEGVSLDAGEPVALGAGRLEVEGLERGGVGQQLLVGLPSLRVSLARSATPASARASWTRGSARKAFDFCRSVR